MNWVRAALSALAMLAASVGSAAAQEGRWLRTETPLFIVYSDGSERAVREAIEDLESFDAFLCSITGVDAASRNQPRLEVYLFRTQSMIRRVRPDTPNSIFGFYLANTEAVAIFSVLRTGASMDERHALYHEYAHHFTFQNFPAFYPAWYAEGFAEYVATAEVSRGRLEYGKPSENRAVWLGNQRWISFERVLTAQPSELSYLETAMFYAQSWLLVHYILSTAERNDAFRVYAQAMQRGADPIATFSEVFQTTPDELTRTLQSYSRRLPYRTRAGWDGGPHAPLTFERLSPAADEILPLAARLRAGLVAPDELEAFVATVRAAAAPYPNDLLAQTTLARAELEASRFERAREILTPLIASHPDSLDAHYLMGGTYLMEGWEHPERDVPALNLLARRHLARANAIDRRHAPTLYRYAQAAWTDPTQDENAFDVLLEARALAPQVPEIAGAAAISLMERGRHAEAARLLRPIAHNPHAGPEAASFRLLLSRAEQGLPPPAGDFEALGPDAAPK